MMTGFVDVNRPVAAIAQQRQASPAHRYCATTVVTGHLSVATVGYGPLLQCLFIVVMAHIVSFAFCTI
jgi:hypothetical protein